MKICIVGAGNIGMRYFEGIKRRFPKAEFFLVDRDSRLLELDKLLIGQAKSFSSVDHIDEHIDLCVVATSCDSRLAIYKQCLKLKPRYVILEKYLFKLRDEFTECMSLSRVPTFVNQWMYGSKTFDSLFNGGVNSVEIRGSNWGLACNSVHWIDLLKRQMGISELEVGEHSCVDQVFSSKRTGFEEVYGDWIFEDKTSDRSFRLVDRPADTSETGVVIIVDMVRYNFDYKTITCHGAVISRFPYFSDQVGGIVEELLASGSCCLPILEESISQHLLIEDIFDNLGRRPHIT